MILIALHDGDPNFGVIGLPHAIELPAIKWKLLNLRKLLESNPDKHARQREAIAALRVG